MLSGMFRPTINIFLAMAAVTCLAPWLSIAGDSEVLVDADPI